MGRVRVTTIAVEKQQVVPTLRVGACVLAFVNRHAHRIFSAAACLALQCFSILSHKRNDVLRRKMCVYFFYKIV